MRRRDFMGSGALAGTLAGLRLRRANADVPVHRWDGYDFGRGPAVPDRLNQGPFGIDQDAGWYTILVTTPSEKPLRNYGLGLVGYTWEENGPSLAVREGGESLERHVEKLASLPFVSVLYIRCDWRDVQRRPGRLDLSPVWALTLAAAKAHGLRVAFRVQLSSPNFQPKQLSMPDFLQSRVPLVKIGRQPASSTFDYLEPRYDHPAFQSAFRELNELLAAEFDGNPSVEFADLMMYGWWGEGHTADLPNPFPDALTAERTTVEMARLQIDAWKRVPLAVNTQPDISSVGNNEVLDMVVRAGGWVRSDSIVLDEPIQIEELANRPPWLACVMEDGYYRHYRVDAKTPVDDAGVTVIENGLLHALDLGANYWSLWTEADNLRAYYERYPRGFDTLQRRLGYRVRPSWVWQRKRYGTAELVVGFSNDGVAGVPGALRVMVEDMEGRWAVGGCLDAGHPFAGKVRQASFVLPPGTDGKRVRLRAEIETKGGVRRPVAWACEQRLDEQGALVVQTKPHGDADWRKGI